ncbi:hypothetical protein A2U01_0031844, partial [Trifolium medium]|nr:hypothetical protein [Trifolium medium]
MSGGDSIDSGTDGARFGINYNVSTSTSASTFGSDKSDRAPFINGDSTLFSFWKTKIKLFTEDQKKQYKKHHKVKSILTRSISHSEFLKISSKSSAKFIWDSLCSTYEGNEQ